MLSVKFVSLSLRTKSRQHIWENRKLRLLASFTIRTQCPSFLLVSVTSAESMRFAWGVESHVGDDLYSSQAVANTGVHMQARWTQDASTIL